MRPSFADAFVGEICAVEFVAMGTCIAKGMGQTLSSFGLNETEN